MELISLAEAVRWSSAKWRNKNGCMTKFMGLDNVRGKIVMDYGCGLGLDAVKFVEYGAEVMLADMHPVGLYLAQQVMCSKLGIIPHGLVITLGNAPWFFSPSKIDLFWSLGVLHHTPFMPQILKRVCDFLNPGGEIRIVLYSDKNWESAMGESAPDGQIWKYPRFQEWVKKMDSVGCYADFYNEKKIKEVVGDFLDVKECVYVSDDRFVGVCLQPKL